MCTLFLVRTNCWPNSQVAGDLGHHYHCNDLKLSTEPTCGCRVGDRPLSHRIDNGGGGGGRGWVCDEQRRGDHVRTGSGKYGRHEVPPEHVALEREIVQ